MSSRINAAYIVKIQTLIWTNNNIENILAMVKEVLTIQLIG